MTDSALDAAAPVSGATDTIPADPSPPGGSRTPPPPEGVRTPSLPEGSRTPSPLDPPPGDPVTALDDDLVEYGADLVGALIGMIKRIGAMRNRLAPTGDFDISQTFLLIHLAEQGPTRAGELAEMVCADPSTVSRQVAALVRAGLVERRADPEDGRASLLVTTRAGRDVIAWHRRMRGAVIGPLIADWTPAERDTFLRLLAGLTRGLDDRRDDILATLLAHRPDRSR